jgi:hypothetical protein
MLDFERWADGDHKEVAREIARLGLEREAYELEVFGLTVVPADRTGAAPVAARAFERVCELVEERTGTAPDVDGGTTHLDVFVPSLHHVIHEGEPFEELVMHPMGHALAALLVGRRWILSGTEVFMKGPATGADDGPLRRSQSGVLQLGLHSDMVTFPEPFPEIAPFCNMTWLLSDYTKEDGALAFVPGSHRYRRQPRAGEGVDEAVPVEAPLGSMVIWHGNTWHGSYPRTRPGLRTGLAFGLAREYFHPHEPVRRDVTGEMIERNGPRFAQLAGHDVVDWGTEGPDYAKLVARPFRYSIHT